MRSLASQLHLNTRLVSNRRLLVGHQMERCNLPTGGSDGDVLINQRSAHRVSLAARCGQLCGAALQPPRLNREQVGRVEAQRPVDCLIGTQQKPEGVVPASIVRRLTDAYAVHVNPVCVPILAVRSTQAQLDRLSLGIRGQLK